MPDDIKSLNVILQDPHKGWPTLNALNNKWVHLDTEHIEKIKKLIDINRICMIRGAEGRGKTVLARLVGFEFKSQKDWDVFVIEVPESKGNIDSICDTICSIENKKTLFIIENVHTSDEISLKLVETANKSQKACFIFTARKIFSDETSDGDIGNPFEEWIENGWYVDLSPDLTTISKIIKKFVLEKNRDYTLSLEDELWIKREFGGEMLNLRRLRFYLEAWNDKSDAPLSSIKREDILNSIYKNYIIPIRDHNVRDMLIKVAAVFQFDVNFSGGNFDKNLLKGLSDNVVITPLPGYFYRLQHSTDAAYIVEAEASLRANKASDDFTIEILKDYLRKEPENYFELFRALRRNDKKDILSTIFDDDKIYKIILNMVRQDSVKALSSVIGCLIWSCRKEKGLKFWKQYKESYGSPEEQKKNLQDKLNNATLLEIWFLLSFIKKLDVNERDWLLDGLDFKALGERSKDTGLATVMNFLKLARQAGVDKDKLNTFCDGLDFKALGERSKDTGLAAVRMFLQLTRQAGVGSDKLNAFCAGLDFKGLGERSKDTGLAAVRMFLQLTRQAGVGSDKLNAFCAGLDFKGLGERSKDTGLATVMTFLRLARQAGVGSDKLNAFCAGLDFKGLGERSKDTGLANVMTFLQLARQAGVGEDILKSFCESLDWKKLGEAVGKKIDETKSPFFEFHSVQAYSFISKEMATLFIEGISWSRLNKAINEQFSPDILAAAVKLLTHKCNLKRNEFMEKGLDLNPDKIWLNSFVNNPCPRVAVSQQPIQQYYLCYAATSFVKFAEKEFSNRAGEMSLKLWNILIHNISVACLPKYLEEKIIPLFKDLPVKRLEELICESDLSNIGIFLNRFNPEDGIFKWSIPEEIDFKKINFLEKIEDSTLEAISHFLFNFYFINRGDLSHYFAEQVNNNYSLLIPKITYASIAELDFFFWNLWMAMPEGKKPIISVDKNIIEIISKKLIKEKQDKESILGLFGTLNLSMSLVDEGLTNLLNAENAKSICQKAVKEGSIKFIRLLGGCLLLLPKNELGEIYNEIQKTSFQFNVNVPNQIEALKFIEKSLINSE